MSAMKHRFSAEVVARDDKGIATTWVGRCGQHQSYAGPSYEDIEDQWRKHVYAETGTVPKSAGRKENRWQPEAVQA